MNRIDTADAAPGTASPLRNRPGLVVGIVVLILAAGSVLVRVVLPPPIDPVVSSYLAALQRGDAQKAHALTTLPAQMGPGRAIGPANLAALHAGDRIVSFEAQRGDPLHVTIEWAKDGEQVRRFTVLGGRIREDVRIVNIRTVPGAVRGLSIDGVPVDGVRSKREGRTRIYTLWVLRDARRVAAPAGRWTEAVEATIEPRQAIEIGRVDHATLELTVGAKGRRRALRMAQAGLARDRTLGPCAGYTDDPFASLASALSFGGDVFAMEGTTRKAAVGTSTFMIARPVVDVKVRVRGTQAAPLLLGEGDRRSRDVRVRVSFPAKGEPLIEHYCWN